MSSGQFLAETPEQSTIGLGVGTLYSDIVTNYGLKTKESLKFVSTSSTNYSSTLGYTCGVGAGWIDNS